VVTVQSESRLVVVVVVADAVGFCDDISSVAVVVVDDVVSDILSMLLLISPIEVSWTCKEGKRISNASFRI
jgi:hypothetical protein